MVRQSFVFADFGEYWFFAKVLTENQRDIIFNTLSEEEQSHLKKSYKDGGWEDVLIRNQIDNLLDILLEKHNINFLKIKAKVSSGKSHYIKLKDWELIMDMFSAFDTQHTYFLFNHINAHQETEDMVLLTK